MAVAALHGSLAATLTRHFSEATSLGVAAV
jgi:hypothetical protein